MKSTYWTIGAVIAATFFAVFFSPILYLTSFIVATLSVFYVFILIVSDGDITLMLYEQFGNNGDNLKNKVIWITGASSGIGKHLALHLAGKGAKLVLSSRSEDKLQTVKSECILRHGVEESDILVLPVDVTKFETHQSAADTVLQHFKKIDILVNNAGRSQRAYVSDTVLEVDKALLDSNILGPISLTKAVLPSMLAEGHGHIVNMGSVAGRMGVMFAATYSATKHALHGYFDAAQMELFDHNIQVTNVCPGPVVSNIVENAVQQDFDQPPLHNYDGYGDRKLLMTSERCAELTTIAMANNLGEIWVSIQPVLIFCYIAHYMPQLYMLIAKRLGKKRQEMMEKSQEKKQK